VLIYSVSILFLFCSRRYLKDWRLAENTWTNICHRRTTEIQSTIASAFSNVLFTQLYPRSTIQITLHVLAQDGAVLAACINAATLALVDAGIPMPDYLVACTGGTTLSAGAALRAGAEEQADPLLDLNNQEEQELPWLTAATVGATDRVGILVMESRCRSDRVESMLAVAVDGCKQVREILDGIIRAHGKRLLEGVVG
jgi:exosome complex component RRP41